MPTIEALTGAEIESRVCRAPGPVILDFYQASCPPCRVLEPRLERVARRFAGRVPVYRVDIDRDLAVAERFDVMSIPTVLLIRAGDEVARLDGLITDSQLVTTFDQALHA